MKNDTRTVVLIAVIIAALIVASYLLRKRTSSSVTLRVSDSRFPELTGLKIGDATHEQMRRAEINKLIVVPSLTYSS